MLPHPESLQEEDSTESQGGLAIWISESVPGGPAGLSLVHHSPRANLTLRTVSLWAEVKLLQTECILHKCLTNKHCAAFQCAVRNNTLKT